MCWCPPPDQMAAGAPVLGYVTMALKDLANGKNPRPVNDAKTWAAAMIQGGRFGGRGDDLFGEYSRFAGGLGETVLGPVLGEGLTDVMNVWNEIRTPRRATIQGAAFTTSGRRRDIAHGGTRFINLFYTRIAVNYLAVHQLQKMLNPGYLRRSERQRSRSQALN